MKLLPSVLTTNSGKVKNSFALKLDGGRPLSKRSTQRLAEALLWCPGALLVSVALLFTLSPAAAAGSAGQATVRRISAEAAEEARYLVQASRQLARCRRSFECRERNFVTSMRFGHAFLASDYPHAT